MSAQGGRLHNANKSCWNCPAIDLAGKVDFRACGQTTESFDKDASSGDARIMATGSIKLKWLPTKSSGSSSGKPACPSMCRSVSTANAARIIPCNTPRISRRRGYGYSTAFAAASAAAVSTVLVFMVQIPSP